MNLQLEMRWDKGLHGWDLHTCLKCAQNLGKDYVDWVVSRMGRWSKSQWTQTESCWARCAVSVAEVAVPVAGVAAALAEGASGVVGAAV